jgi:dethiobiotin synthetase
MRKTILVTGTDTGVGKTVVGGALAGALRRKGINAGVMKPVATGCATEDGEAFSLDTRFLRAVSGVEEPDFMLTPVALEPPLAPAVATRMTSAEWSARQVSIALEELLDRHPIVFVEGVGGFMVPLNNELLVCDFAKRHGMTVVVVARPTIGTINHALLTVEAAWRRDLRVAGVVFSQTRADDRDLSTETNAAEIARISGVRILGTLPFDPEASVEGLRPGRLVDLALEHLDITGFIERECRE